MGAANAITLLSPLSLFRGSRLREVHCGAALPRALLFLDSFTSSSFSRRPVHAPPYFLPPPSRLGE